MKILGAKMNQSGMVLGGKLVGSGKMLGSKTSSHRQQSVFHNNATAGVQRSDLERGHRIPLDGQNLLTHGTPSRLQYQRRKNH